MPESVDAYRYLSYLRSRWWFIAASCAVAVGLALAVSLTLPKKYTAICRILIEAPAGADLRALSPIYLESLKTYEQFAASDTLFLQALDKFQLRQRFPERPVESLKAGMLKVAMVRDTKILEIKVTLPDPKTAQALAQYLGEETVNLSRTVGQEGDRELIQGIEKQEAEARARMQQSEAAWSRMLAERPVEKLQEEVFNGAYLEDSLKRQLLAAETDAAGGPPEAAAAARARAGTLRQQLAQVKRDLDSQQELLARREAERDRLEAERAASQAAHNAIAARLSQMRGDLGYRSERLKVIDPGIVPERPSSPNVPLNLFAALLLGILAPVVYLTLELSYRTQRSNARRSTLRVAGTGSDD